jgi:hypothetical protein
MNFLLLFLFFSQPAVSDNANTVKGVVYDRDGMMPSVIVTELGTDDKNKVYTNNDGEFEINPLTEDPELEFTFVGYASKRIRIKNRNFVKVKLRQDLLKE